jgi:hypothetical protein
MQRRKANVNTNALIAIDDHVHLETEMAKIEFPNSQR